jgi:hypothetical protein
MSALLPTTDTRFLLFHKTFRSIIKTFRSIIQTAPENPAAAIIPEKK